MNGKRYRAILHAAVMVVTAVLSGCNEPVKTDKPTDGQTVAPPPTRTETDLPTLAQVQSAVSPVVPPEPEPLIVQRTMTIQKMVYPRDDGRVDVALNALEPVDLPADKAAIWQANGLHIARLPAERLALWTANLPEPVLLSGVNILPGRDYGRVSLVGRSSGRTLVHQAGDGSQPRTERFFGGRYQLLLKLTRSVEDPEQILIDLMPHHVGPRDQFRMTEDDGDPAGRMFDELRLLTSAPEKEAWLIWSNTHKPTAEKTDGAEAGETDLSPPRLGRSMMTGLRQGKPVRLVLVVYLK